MDKRTTSSSLSSLLEIVSILILLSSCKPLDTLILENPPSQFTPTPTVVESTEIVSVFFQVEPEQLRIYGLIKNIGNVDVRISRVHIYFMDSNDKDIFTATIMPAYTLLKPGELAPFHEIVDFPGPVPKWKSYTYYFEYGLSSPAEYCDTYHYSWTHDFVVLSSEMSPYIPDTKSVQITGTIINTDPRPSEFVHLTAVLFDKNDDIVGIVDGSTEKELLKHGEISEFMILGVFDKEPVRYEFYVEGEVPCE